MNYNHNQSKSLPQTLIEENSGFKAQCWHDDVEQTAVNLERCRSSPPSQEYQILRPILKWTRATHLNNAARVTLLPAQNQNEKAVCTWEAEGALKSKNP